MSESILNNDSLRQIVCDSLAVEFKNKTLQLKMENCNLTSQKDNLDITLDNQQQYSRTVASNLFWYMATHFSYLNFCSTTIILVKNKKVFIENLSIIF